MKILYIILLGFFTLLFNPQKSLSQKQVTDSIETDVEFKDMSIAVYPAIGYTPETSVQLGVIGFLVMKDEEKSAAEFYRPTSISPYFLYTLNNQIMTAIDLDVYFTNGLSLNSKVRYYNYPDYFYGIGNDNLLENEEMYTNKYVRMDGRLLKPFTDKLFAGINFNIQYNNLSKFEEGNLLAVNEYTGEEGGWSNGLGLSALFDSRNSTLYPSSGSLVSFGFIAFSKVFGSDYAYTSFEFDARKFWKISSEKNIIGWQGYFNFTSGNDIPFYNLNKIGGDEKLRGIENANLYIDRQAWYTQVEFRRDLFWRLGAVVFAGVGDVANKISGFSADETKYVVGIGGRFQALKDEKFNIRLDAGIGKDGQSAFYLSVREAF